MLNRDTLLICCEIQDRCTALCSIFQKRYNILQAENIEQAAALLTQNACCISAVVIDLTSWERLSPEKLSQLRRIASNPDIPVLGVATSASPELQEELMNAGVRDIMNEPFSPRLLRRHLQNIVDLNLYRVHLDRFAKDQAAFLQRSNETIVETLSSIIEYRSLESGQHVQRIRRFTEILLKEVVRSYPEYNLDEDTIQIIASASTLHDIGKIAISDAVLKKPGPLTPEERREIQTHPIVGYRILEMLTGIVDDEYLYYARQIAYCHHERWDGCGYPNRLRGDEIPIFAQVVGLTDAYDALTSKRVYKDAYSQDEAADMILGGECGAFSPKLLECFQRVAEDFSDLAMEYRDGADLKEDEPMLPDLSQNGKPERDTLQFVQDKYQAVLHYLDATVLEMDMDESVYRIVYNPDPNLLVLNSVTSFENFTQIAMKNLIIPEEAAAMEDMIDHQIPAFFSDCLRRQHRDFHIKNFAGGEPYLYRMTLLRIDPIHSGRKRMLFIIQNVSSQETDDPEKYCDSVSDEFATLRAVDTLYSVRHDSHLTLYRCSDEMIALLGYTPDELQEEYHNHMAELIHPEDRARVFAQIDEQLSEGVEFVAEYRIRHKNGKYLWVLNKGRLFMEYEGNEYLHCLLLDISKSKAAEDVLQETLERQAIILAQTENVIFECNMEGGEAYFSEQWREMFGYELKSGDIRNQIFMEQHIHPDDLPLAASALYALKNGSPYEAVDVRIAKADGHYLWCQVRVTVQYDAMGEPLKMVGVIININEQKCSEEELKNRAERDALTGLLNKEAVKYYIETYLNSASSHGISALMVIDLDNFKQVNDQYGHMLGDTIITQSAHEIKRMFRSEDLVGRIGGDEFVVLMKNIPSLELLESRLNELIFVFATEVHARVPEANLGCSVGVALYPQHAVQYQDLLRQADQALYQAKAKGKNGYRIYEPGTSFTRSCEKRQAAAVSEEEQKAAFTIDKLMQYTFRQLYLSGNIEQTVDSVLRLVGRQMNVSRTYIFENDADNTSCSNTFEWCNDGITPEINNLQNLSYTEDLLQYEQNFNEQGIFYCPDIRALPEEQYNVLAPQGIKSMLQCAICDNGVFRGFVGFDECNSNRLWTQQQIDALIFFSEIISTFLLKKRIQQEIRHRAQNLTSVLENQKAWIYVIDPDTFKLLYVNQKTKMLDPGIAEGKFCYKCIMKQDQPCPNCPAMKLKTQPNDEQFIFNESLKLHVYSEATSIQWNGREAYLITCHEMKPKN